MSAAPYTKGLNPHSKLEILSGDRLESWKEIAAYLNRSERTVRRWEEREGLPVHRLQHNKRGSVYASRNELDQWRGSRRQVIEASPTESRSRDGLLRSPWLWTGVALVLAVGVAATALRPPRPAEPTKRPPHPNALRAAKKAVEFSWNPRRTQILTGIHDYQEAIRFDPRFGRAWIGLATAHVTLAQLGEVRSSEVIPQAKLEAETALKLSATLTGAWPVLGRISHSYEWNHVEAERQFRKGLESRTKDGIAESWFAEYLLNMRRFDEAKQEATRSQDFAPIWLGSTMVAANVHLFSGHPDLAMAEYARVLGIEPEHGLANHFLGRAYLAAGQHEKAIAQLRKSNEILGKVPMSIADLGYALGVARKREEAEKMLSELTHRREHGYYPAFAIAQIYMGLGNTDTALDWLERAIEERNVGYHLPSVEPIYDPLRSNPRFQGLLRRMNLLPAE